VGSGGRRRPVRFILPALRWRLAARPPRPLAASPTSVPLSLAGLDLGIAAPLWCCVWPIPLLQGAVADWIGPLQFSPFRRRMRVVLLCALVCAGPGAWLCGRWCWSLDPSAVLHEAGCVVACSSGCVSLLAQGSKE
jgi:hypothetical protein